MKLMSRPPKRPTLDTASGNSSTSDTRLLKSNCSPVHFSFNLSILISEMSCCESSVISQPVTFSMLLCCTVSAQWNLIWSLEYQLLAPVRLRLRHHVPSFNLVFITDCCQRIKMSHGSQAG